MPYTADVDTTAAKVVKGDHFRIINGNRDYAMLIDTVKVGDKWTVARDPEGALIFRKLNTDQVWVMREVPTEAELAAKKEETDRAVTEWHIDRLTEMHAKMDDMVHVAKQEIRKALDNEGFLNTSLMEDLLTAQEYKVIATQVHTAMQVNPFLNVKEAMELVADKIKDGLVEGHSEPTQSGGFTLSNADRQIKITARRKFLQGIAWGVL